MNPVINKVKVFSIAVLFLLSCHTSKKLLKPKYYDDGYSLNFSYDANLKVYVLQSTSLDASALIPNIDNLEFNNNQLIFTGILKNPPVMGDKGYKRIEDAIILYAKEYEPRRLKLIDSIGITGKDGKINLNIKNPLPEFYLLFIKDGLIPCALKLKQKEK